MNALEFSSGLLEKKLASIRFQIWRYENDNNEAFLISG